jgi:hypothetical protein
MQKDYQVPPLNSIKLSASNPPSGANIYLSREAVDLLGGPEALCQITHHSVDAGGSISVDLTGGHKRGASIVHIGDNRTLPYRVHVPIEDAFSRMDKFGLVPCTVTDIDGNYRVTFIIPAERPKPLCRTRRKQGPAVKNDDVLVERLGALLTELNALLEVSRPEFAHVRFSLSYAHPDDPNIQMAVTDCAAPLSIRGRIIREETLG